jgi:hypothetical protein
MDSLRHLLDHPHRRFVYIRGEAGIGKTRLLEETARIAVEQGWHCFGAGCHRWSNAEIYAPILDSIERHMVNLEPKTRTRLLSEYPAIRRILTDVGDDLFAEMGDAQAAYLQRSLFASVARFFTDHAGPAGTILLLDDLQWAGKETVRLLQFLINRTTTLPFLIVAACRATEVPYSHPVAHLTVDTVRSGRGSVLELSELSPEAVGEIVTDLLGEGVPSERVRTVTDRVNRATGGIPYFVLHYAVALTASDSPDVPESIVGTIRQQHVLLPSHVRDVVEVVVRAGGCLDRSALFDALQEKYPAAEIGDGIRIAIDRRMLQQEEWGDVRIAHEPLQEVISADLKGTRGLVLGGEPATAPAAGS